MTEGLIRDQILERIPAGVEAEVIVTTDRTSLTRFANSFIHQNVSDVATRADLTVHADGRVAGGSTASTSDSDLAKLVAAALEAARTMPVDDRFPGFGDVAAIPKVAHHDRMTADASPGDRAGVVAAFVDAGDGLRGAGYCETIEQRTAYGNTNGQAAYGEVTRATVDGIHQTSSSAGKAHQTSIAFGDIDGAAAGDLAASKARAGESTFDLKPGRYEVVLEPNAVGTIAAFLSLYGFNGLAVVEGRSFAKLGEMIFDEAISLWDDGTDPRAISPPFDSEGTPKRPTALVEGGKIVGHVHDRSTGALTGVASTGHAVSAKDRGYGPIASNMFVAPGVATQESMIASIDRGLLVSEFNYCRVLDPLTVGMTGLTRNGTFMIENGVVTGAVSNLRFTQSVIQALGAGNVVGVESVARMADSEFGVGATYVPSLHLAEWNFTGGAGG